MNNKRKREKKSVLYVLKKKKKRMVFQTLCSVLTVQTAASLRREPHTDLITNTLCSAVEATAAHYAFSGVPRKQPQRNSSLSGTRLLRPDAQQFEKSLLGRGLKESFQM
jgi:hypothetical protein